MYIISVNKPRYFRNGNDYADQYLPVQAEGTEATGVSRMGVARDWVVSGQELYLVRNQSLIWSKWSALCAPVQ